MAKIALVLSGGGAKGAFQFMAEKYAREVKGYRQMERHRGGLRRRPQWDHTGHGEIPAIGRDLENHFAR